MDPFTGGAFGALTSLTGGGGLSAGGGKSESGDASGKSDGSFVTSSQYNAAFQVGGSGSSLAQTQTAQQTPSLSNPTQASLPYIYIAIGAVAFIALITLFKRRAS